MHLDMSSSSHEELILKSGKYLAEALERDANLAYWAKRLRRMSPEDNTDTITDVAKTIHTSKNETVEYLIHWNSYHGWWFVIYTAWYELVVNTKQPEIDTLETAKGLLSELVHNSRPYTDVNANSTGMHCNFCRAIVFDHKETLKHDDNCLITRAYNLLKEISYSSQSH